VSGLFSRGTGVLGELFFGCAADGMADDNEFVIWHAEDTAHHFGRGDKARRHYADGGDTLPFRCYCVVQTAR
jgi:hypothetical protein